MALSVTHAPIGAGAVWRSHMGIPVRNLWMLLVYAADLADFLERFDAVADESAELPELLARLLAVVVERRIRRSLSRGYQPKAELVSRVRGRIDWLQTESGLHVQRGQVACRFEDLCHDTARNRLVRAALEAMESRIANREVAARCGQLAGALGQAGVSAGRPSRAELSRDRIARHDSDDRLMVAVATLALDVVLPSETAGDTPVTALARDERLLRRIFEKAILGFYRHELRGRQGWSVHSPKFRWQTELPTPDLPALLPIMQTDIVIDRAPNRRIVFDTKFAGIITRRRFGGGGLKSAHIYQLYSYLRSQAGKGHAMADSAQGILLHPSLDRHVDEAVTIQGHRIRFVTVDLSLPSAAIRQALLDLVQAPPI